MTTHMLCGLGLKPEHHDAALACRSEGMWFEVHAENYLVAGGPRLRLLEAVRALHPLSLHGVSLSLAGDAPLAPAQLERLSTLVRRVEPALVSEHLAWSAWRGISVPDLLPFPRSKDALRRIASNIDQMQSALGCRVAIENPSHYLPIDGHEWDEIGFLRELVHRTGCGLLLDVNNVYVSSRNLCFDAFSYLDRFPAESVIEIHLAGHTVDPALGETLLIDSHNAPIAPAVWDLYRHLIERIGARPTLIERDGNVPAFGALLDECHIAATELRRVAELSGRPS
ncbi:MAG: DUF692 domain-containing protein [Betaproteobacteria bacterium]|nr:DUF692 domain-containing protein [Betaproteobacteria bacterium]